MGIINVWAAATAISSGIACLVALATNPFGYRDEKHGEAG
jgi:hypothetical protein